MIYKIPKTPLIIGGVWLILLALIGWGLFYVQTFPQKHPDRTLELEAQVREIIQRITLPIKLAKLSGQEPDQQLLMPVHGHRVSEIAQTWASPRSGGRTHEGQDIFAARGTPIFSATRGFVTRLGTGDLGGNFVYITGAGRTRYYYAHLDRIAEGLSVGDEVTTDTLLGFVGNTGNAETTPPHLHFGMYRIGEPTDPLPLLINR